MKKPVTLKTLSEKYTLLKISINNLIEYSEKVKTQENFNQNLDDRSREYSFISGYLWALVDTGKISLENMDKLIEELTRCLKEGQAYDE